MDREREGRGGGEDEEPQLATLVLSHPDVASERERERDRERRVYQEGSSPASRPQSPLVRTSQALALWSGGNSLVLHPFHIQKGGERYTFSTSIL